ncbi:MAG TPA: ATP-binding protein [Terriglobales bacterium]|nr:ATP-binding protein [Terriglobales bacterium]
MRSLFLKIFLSYWMAQALFLALAIIVTFAMRPTREISNLQALEPKFLNETLQAYQTGGDEAARKYMRGVHDNLHVRLFIFDDQGRDLLGRKAPDWIDRVRAGRIHTADTFLGRFGPGQFLRQTITADNGRRYTVIVDFPPEEHPFFGLHSVPGLGIMIAVISSGLVCYILARYLTSPIVQLRAATQKLASGDLTARAGVPGSRRHDEMAELMRDFDRMAERLENLVNAQSRLLTDISHELRSPLARLNVALELARQRSGSEARSALDRIDREANRLNELIQKLLTIARLEAGDESIEKVPVHLEKIIHEIARDAAFEAQSRNCQVEARVMDDCVVMGSPSLLHSAIENVVRNAIRYTQEGTSVEVRLEEGVGLPVTVQDAGQKNDGAGKPEAVVRVTDSGPGVPEDALDKLFRPFYRIDDARGRQTGGVGLGLAITDRAVRLHGGTIRVSNRPQGGLMVEIRLPLASAEVNSTPDQQTFTILSREL